MAGYTYIKTENNAANPRFITTNNFVIHRKIKFSNYVIPNKHDFKTIDTATLKVPVGISTMGEASFTFPTSAEKFYIHFIAFEEIPEETLVSIKFGNKGQSLSINALPILYKHYVKTLKIVPEEFWGVPIEIEGEDTIIFTFQFPESSIGTPKDGKVFISYFS